jgi:hypothetical protein
VTGTEASLARHGRTHASADEQEVLPMYALALVYASPFRFLPTLIFPVVAIAIIALLVYFLRHRAGRKRG